MTMSSDFCFPGLSSVSPGSTRNEVGNDQLTSYIIPPIAEKYAKTILSLPMYNGMTDEEIQYVIDVINNF